MKHNYSFEICTEWSHKNHSNDSGEMKKELFKMKLKRRQTSAMTSTTLLTLCHAGITIDRLLFSMLCVVVGSDKCVHINCLEAICVCAPRRHTQRPIVIRNLHATDRMANFKTESNSKRFASSHTLYLFSLCLLVCHLFLRVFPCCQFIHLTIIDLNF